MGLVKNSKVSEALTSLQAKKLACYSLVQLGRRLENPESETRNLVTNINNSSHSISISPSLCLYRMVRRDSGVTCTCSESSYRRENESWGHKSFVMVSKYGRLPFALEGNMILIFQGCLLFNHAEKIVRNKVSYCHCLKDMQKCRRPMENCLPIYFDCKTHITATRPHWLGSVSADKQTWCWNGLLLKWKHFSSINFCHWNAIDSQAIESCDEPHWERYI